MAWVMMVATATDSALHSLFKLYESKHQHKFSQFIQKHKHTFEQLSLVSHTDVKWTNCTSRSSDTGSGNDHYNTEVDKTDRHIS